MVGNTYPWVFTVTVFPEIGLKTNVGFPQFLLRVRVPRAPNACGETCAERIL